MMMLLRDVVAICSTVCSGQTVLDAQAPSDIPYIDPDRGIYTNHIYTNYY